MELHHSSRVKLRILTSARSLSTRPKANRSTQKPASSIQTDIFRQTLFAFDLFNFDFLLNVIAVPVSVARLLSHSVGEVGGLILEGNANRNRYNS